MAHAQAQPGFDPRRTITPESFHVAPHLLGLPLASPSRRLAAILVDLLLCSILANIGGKVLFALALSAAFFWFAGRRLNRQGTFFSRSGRAAFRGFGALMLFIASVALWNRVKPEIPGVGDDDDAPPAAAPVATASAAGGAPKKVTPGTAVRMAMAIRAMGAAKDSAAAYDATRRTLREMRQLGVSAHDLSLSMEEGEDDRSDEVNAGIRAAMAQDSAATQGARTDSVPTPPDSLAELMVTALHTGDSTRADALRPKLASALARDSLDELRGRVRELEHDKSELEKEKEKAENQGLLATLLHWLDDLGIGFGWTGLYFTAFTAMLKGQTPGKRLFGIRALRLDGGPMTLWASFERFGGYAAGLFTGLMGYAQVFWDRNRQAIQDKISETVVIRDVGLPLPTAPVRPAPAMPPRPPEMAAR